MGTQKRRDLTTIILLGTAGGRGEVIIMNRKGALGFLMRVPCSTVGVGRKQRTGADEVEERNTLEFPAGALKSIGG